MSNLFRPSLNFLVVAVAPAEAVLGRPSVELSHELVTLGLCSCQALLPSASATGKINVKLSMVLYSVMPHNSTECSILQHTLTPYDFKLYHIDSYCNNVVLQHKNKANHHEIE